MRDEVYSPIYSGPRTPPPRPIHRHFVSISTNDHLDVLLGSSLPMFSTRRRALGSDTWETYPLIAREGPWSKTENPFSVKENSVRSERRDRSEGQ